MAEEIYENIYKIEVPLPKNPLKFLNSYFIKGNSRNLLIDTGFNCQESKVALKDFFREQRVSLKDTDFLITHLHADHSGLVSQLATSRSKIFMSRKDGDIVNEFHKDRYWNDMEQLFHRHGMPLRLEDRDLHRHPGEIFHGEKGFSFVPLRQGQRLVVGDFKLKVMIFSGHSPEHVCLFEEEKGFFFSGDQVLDKITPVIAVERGMSQPLEAYLQSLKAMKMLNVKRCFPAHRSEIKNFQERLRQLEEHHRQRLTEILTVFQKEKRAMNAYEVASQMTWRMTKARWEEVPRQQRWFATGEAMAHLIYLEGKGILKQQQQGNKIFFVKEGSYENCGIAQTVF